MKTFKLVLLFVALGLIACRSKVIQVTLMNDSAQPVSTIIVDYPGGIFGDNSLAPGKTYVYKIKLVESGPLKLEFTDAQGARHQNVVLPLLHKGQEGSIEIHLTQQASTAVAAVR